MITHDQAQDVIGATAYTGTGDKLGKVGQLFLDDQTGEPAFVTVNTGLFGMNESYVPIAEASWDGDRLTVPYEKDTIKDAPNVDVDHGHLDPAEESRLYTHYGLGTSATTTYDDTAGQTTSSPTLGTTQPSTPSTDAAGDDAMTRSEERLEVGKTDQEVGRARLRKYVTTEEETHTIPVRKERAVVETEPITDANAGDAHGGPEITEDEHEVVLHEERPVVETTAEPVERVRLGTEEVVDEQAVSGEVRKEHIELEDDPGAPR